MEHTAEADEGKMLGVPQAADYLGISEEQLRELMDEGKVPYYRPQRRAFFSSLELDAWRQNSE